MCSNVVSVWSDVLPSGLLCQKFIVESVLKEFSKSLNVSQSYREKVDYLKRPERRSAVPLKDENSLEIWSRNCRNSITLRLIPLAILHCLIDKCQPGIVLTTCYSPTDAVSDWTFVSRRFVTTSSFLVDGYAYSRSYSAGISIWSL